MLNWLALVLTGRTQLCMQVMIYVPSDVSFNIAFQSIFEIGRPVEIKVDAEKKEMTVRPR